MKVVVRGGIRDLLEFFRLGSIRKRMFRKAPAEIYPLPRIHETSARLHPQRLDLHIDSIVDETELSRTFRLKPEQRSPLPVFREGQYLSLKLVIGDAVLTRPYSISSTPKEAAERGYVDITIQRREDGFATSHIFQTWKEGMNVTATGPHGQFLYEPIRDGKHVVCIAGGCGITPFKPLITDILKRGEDTTVVLLYGITNPGSIIFKGFIDDLISNYPDRFTVTYINSGDQQNWTGESGFIDAEKIERLVPNVRERSFFLCGPLAMYRYLAGQLSGLSLKPGKIRFEAPGDGVDVSLLDGFPVGRRNETVQLTLDYAGSTTQLDALVGETILVAIERAGFSLPSECRSGECGYCRSRLDSGDVYIIPDHDGRRLADIKFGYIHPCASYPLTNVALAVPKDPLKGTYK